MICDAELCHLFFSNDKGRWYKSKTTVDKFPYGMSEPVVVMQDAEAGRLFEACNVYKINGSNKYLALIEAFDKTSDYRRYFRSWTADSLEGPVDGAARRRDVTVRRQANVTLRRRRRGRDDISHGEMIRAGYDETMAIDGTRAPLPVSGVRAGGAHQRLQRDPVAARPAHAEVSGAKRVIGAARAAARAARTRASWRRRRAARGPSPG